MISLQTDTKSASKSPMSLSPSTDDEPTLSFSELLSGVKDSKDSKKIQNGALILSLGAKDENPKDLKSSSKKDILLSLLKNDSKIKGESLSTKDEPLPIKDLKENLELNPKAVENLTVKELKVLINEAKTYLKNKILQTDGYKKSEIKELPKTLKGLVQVAEKFGIDVSKISLEQVKGDIKPTLESLTKEDQNKKPTLESLTKEDQNKKPTLETEVKTPHAKSSKKITSNTLNDDVDLPQELIKKTKEEQKQERTLKEIKSTPLFKVSQKTEHTTEQLVQTKQFTPPTKSAKEKADDTLKLLLRGEKPSMGNSKLTADFSVATAKVIAPSATSETTKSLEQLLHGDKEVKEQTNSKIDGINSSKADPFEVKLKEAKQMVKYISQDVKTAIEDYKSPFTRVKVQLNPQKLGSVELTVVQRGKNLHVNISSNNTAINTLSMHANDLRVQLSNNGINNATLNFNNQDTSSQAGQQEQQRQKEKQAKDEYDYFENEEQNEEILSSLEIIVPRYV
jgi:hypothetical protein